MPKIIKEFFFIFIFFLNLNIYSIEFSTVVEGDGEEVNELLKKALDQSILKVLGSKRDFILNQESFKKLDPSLYVQEYKFINVDEKEALEVTINLKSLQEKLLELNLGITFVENPKISAWVLCKSDFSSIEAAKSLEQKCKYIKKQFKTIAQERGITLIYPILDAVDISLFNLENESDLKKLTIFNDRYPSDGWFFCEVSKTSDWCYLPKNFEKQYSTLDLTSKYKPEIGINILIDNLLSSQRLNPISRYKEIFFVEISGLNNFSGHKKFESNLKNLVFINNVRLLSLKNNSALYSFNLLSDEKNLYDFFKEKEDIQFLNSDQDKIFLSYLEK